MTLIKIRFNCPECRRQYNIEVVSPENHDPSQPVTTICCHCGTFVSLAPDGQMTRLTDEQFNDLPDDHRQLLLSTQKRLAQAKRGLN